MNKRNHKKQAKKMLKAFFECLTLPLIDIEYKIGDKGESIEASYTMPLLVYETTIKFKEELF